MITREQWAVRAIAFAALLVSASVLPVQAQQTTTTPQQQTTTAPPPTTPQTTTATTQPPGTQQVGEPTLEIYGFAMADAIIDLEQNDPDWFDVVRPTKLPAFHHQFGNDGHFYLSPRQSRFGVKGTLPTSEGDVTATFEFEMFGVGADAGRTAFRLRHAWGQWKQFGAGQTNSTFMDGDVFPNTIEYWGPNGMLFFRNVQVFWEPYRDADSHARIAIENPGASADGGLLSDRIVLQNITGRFPAPDLTGHYRFGQSWGYVQAGGALRYFAYDDLIPDDQFDLDGHDWGWGFSLSSNVKPWANDDVIRLQFVYGHGIQNYFNDAPVDVGAETNPGNRVTPFVGEALPIRGLVAYLDHYWSSTWSSSVGYSRVDIDNSNLQEPSAFKNGAYGSANLLYTPVTNVMMGGELQWGHRENFSDGFDTSDYRLQFSFKYSFAAKVIGD